MPFVIVSRCLIAGVALHQEPPTGPQVPGGRDVGPGTVPVDGATVTPRTELS